MRWALLPVCAAIAALGFAACKNTTSVAGGTGDAASGAGAGGSTGAGGSGTGDPAKVSKVDLLFGIDNSRSMADKQQTLTLALADLITGLTNPPCLDQDGNYVSQPGALMACPAGSDRQFQPVLDIHIGIVSSSLGGHGSDACSTSGTGKESNNDHGHLLTRLDPTKPDQVPTYQSEGFLAWDPLQSLNPPGEADPGLIVQHFQELVLGAGQIGCGYEAQLESWYRFLVEPEPAQDVTLDATGNVVLSGMDTFLLGQRKDFLRPDSMLVIVSLSDENDCSIREEEQFYFAAQQKQPNGSPFHLPVPRAICATDPNHQCCFSCAQTGPLDANGDPICPTDLTCLDVNGKTIFLSELEDNINVRCFDQKRRFGIDFLYPTDRYVNALTGATVPNRVGELVPNPLFTDPDPSDPTPQLRGPSLVILSGIVGVPWQDIAKNKDDLKQGFKSSAELSQPNASGQTTWDIILGDPANYVPPLDPFMIESTDHRNGQNPVTGDAITDASATNPINGNDWSIPKKDDLQYACIMPLPEPRDCSAAGALPACDCEDPMNDNPLCELDASSGDPTLQVGAKAYPGLRQLTVLKALGDQATVASICATQISDDTAPDYAYRPAVASLLDRMKNHLK